MITTTATMPDEQWERLKRFNAAAGRDHRSTESVLEKLLDHVDQALTRPGSWERDWLIQAFGPDALAAYDRGEGQL